MKHSEVLIVGGGPAGMAAAVAASAGGGQVTILDDNPAEGGQIWRGGKGRSENRQAASWFQRLAASSVTVLGGTQVIDGDARARTLVAESANGAWEIGYETLILATGARELFLPFPGWTLPNVVGVGGLQALVKCGLPVEGKRIVVAGSGPLLLAVAAYLRHRGARVEAVVEQASGSRLARFSIGLARHPAKAWQAAALRATLGAVPYLPGSWVSAAEGAGRVERVLVRSGAHTRKIACDFLATAYGFCPNSELAEYLRCGLQNGCALVDDLQQTPLAGVYAAGEITGLGGVDLSLIEGEIAGHAAAGEKDRARKLFPLREKARHFAAALDRAFALRDGLRELPEADTMVCRCEDVPMSRLRSASGWRSAKLHERCGMGPCQGRICGPAVQFLFGWKPESVRSPVFPARIGSLVSESTNIEEDRSR